MGVVDRRFRGWLACGLVLLLLGCTARPLAQPGDLVAPSMTPAPDGRMETPESQGFDPVVLSQVLADIRNRELHGHGIVLARQGAIVVDATIYPYDGTTPHSVGGITRMVVATLIGIAVERGYLHLDDPVVRSFPDRTIEGLDGRKAAMTVGDLVTMRSGLDCAGGDDVTAAEAMLDGQDAVAVALDGPMAADPGTIFRPCSQAAHLLSAVLERATGVSAFEFARQFLFEPLGISAVRWTTDALGTSLGWTGLYLLPADLARIGLLWADGGRWDEVQVVPEAWVRATARDRVATGAMDDYALGWWAPLGAPNGQLEAYGDGGQLLRVRPDGLVAVAVGGGVDPIDLVDPLMEAFVSPDTPLLSDPPGEAGLATVLASLRRGPSAERSEAPASTVRAISKVTWALEPNPLDLVSIRLDVRGRDEGRATFGFGAGGPGPATEVDAVGLDGRYRIGLDRARRPIALRGAWSDGRTFVLEADETAEGVGWTLRLTFAADGRTVAVQGSLVGRAGGFVIEGRAAKP